MQVVDSLPYGMLTSMFLALLYDTIHLPLLTPRKEIWSWVT